MSWLSASDQNRWVSCFAVVAVLLVGASLRLIWGADIEYKGDEFWTFERTRCVGQTEPFPSLGMPSSAKVPNPGMSVWIFLGLGKLCRAEDPISLARSVQILNILAITLLVIFAIYVVPKEEREIWLWAAALVSFNPFAVLFHRKIWPPCVLPIFCLLMLAGWWCRRRRWGAFTWGLIGACVGQIHMSGFFLAGAFAFWAFLFDRRHVAWFSWFTGNCLGVIPMIPWLFALWTRSDPIGARRWTHILEMRFWMRWFTEPFGLGLDYTLGDDFADFLCQPLFCGKPTYLVGFLHGILVAIALILLIRAAQQLWHNRRHWVLLLTGRHSPSAFTLSAAFWGFGLLITLSMINNQRHYLIITFPLMFVWIARLALVSNPKRSHDLALGRTCLVILCLSQLAISASFLCYVHGNQRLIKGDYGEPYGAQLKHLATSAPLAGQAVARNCGILPAPYAD